jgi:cellulose synthase/poly-beta-1,6-N-acetylglucosamine synthase-like glycosyltransferase
LKPIAALFTWHFCGLFGFFLIALFWFWQDLRGLRSALTLPRLKSFPPAADADCPRISLLFAARDEEVKLPAALATLAQIDYPNLEIIGVDDRSSDSTGRILDEFARTHPRFRAVHIAELPPGWLGKTHALQTAYENSSGEWLLFTDADVRFVPDAVRRAMRLAKERELDHLTLMGDVEMRGFWETVLVTFFGMAFYLGNNPQGMSNKRSSAYAGVGAFQLLKRATYEASGTHRRLAMEVIDDMKLGKIVKQAGFWTAAALAEDAVTVRWHAGAGNLIRGVTKNFFAAMSYSLPMVAVAVSGLLMVCVVPFFAVWFLHGAVQWICLAAIILALCFHAGVDAVMRVSFLYALTMPLGAVLLCYMLLRSTVITLRDGGVTWRDTFYRLEDLRRGVV